MTYILVAIHTQCCCCVYTYIEGGSRERGDYVNSCLSLTFLGTLVHMGNINIQYPMYS